MATKLCKARANQSARVVLEIFKEVRRKEEVILDDNDCGSLPNATEMRTARRREGGRLT
jgi:hypothetical protein